MSTAASTCASPTPPAARPCLYSKPTPTTWSASGGSACRRMATTSKVVPEPAPGPRIGPGTHGDRLMLAALGLFGLGLVLLALGGDSLVEGAARLGRRGRGPAVATGPLLAA